MSDDLDKARQLIARGAYRKALNVLWRVEANARSDLAEARQLLDLAGVCRWHTGRGVRREYELLVDLATESVKRLSSPPVAVAAPGDVARDEPADPLALTPYRPLARANVDRRATCADGRLRSCRRRLCCCPHRTGRPGDRVRERGGRVQRRALAVRMPSRAVVMARRRRGEWAGPADRGLLPPPIDCRR
jgi:hypothetical protein